MPCPGGASNNMEYYGQWVTFDSRLDDATRLLLFDPETSGGLLIAVAPDAVSSLTAELSARGQSGWQIGRVEPGSGRLRVEA